MKKVEKTSHTSLKVSIGDLSPNKYQPRVNFNEEKLQELANSIKKNGVIQPIAVREDKVDPGRFEIIAGERRWLAAQKAGLHEVPVVQLDLDDNEALEVAIVENIQRDDLNVMKKLKATKDYQMNLIMIMKKLLDLCLKAGVISAIHYDF